MKQGMESSVWRFWGWKGSLCYLLGMEKMPSLAIADRMGGRLVRLLSRGLGGFAPIVDVVKAFGLRSYLRERCGRIQTVHKVK
jgi:hypothetical protein